MTLGNLLTATRTQASSKRGLDYVVDDDFGDHHVDASAVPVVKTLSHTLDKFMTCHFQVVLVIGIIYYALRITLVIAGLHFVLEDKIFHNFGLDYSGKGSQKWRNCKGKLPKKRCFDPILPVFAKKVKERFGRYRKSPYLCIR